MEFRPRDAFRSPRFAQVATFMRLPHVSDPGGLDVALLGIPYDGAVSYRPGPRFAPRDIRQHSVLVRPYNPAQGVNPFAVLRVADVGDVDVDPLGIEQTFARVEDAVERILSAGAVPVCIGGDHSLSLPILRAVARRHGPVGMVHVDAHQDMWEEYFGHRYFHGTPFRRAAEEGLLDTRRVVQVGIRGPVYGEDDFAFARAHGIRWVTAVQVQREGLKPVLELMETLRGGPVYLSFDIDGVDPAFAPGTGTPEPGGLSSREALEVVRALAGLDLVGADLVEVSPPYDHAGITSILAAAVLFEVISALAVTRQGRSTGVPAGGG
ncbi:MAG: agmatinase [Armatimonadota bacterium]|nr:agmatinase [Armatimonadota bacterium]MDR7402014.1 agmatinase [Armatimonadota bacterium]MDR7437965.1 agmatinase [Armatimonadota bacterium]MDR7473091.1 agmatinase [Armatimonadota bacterium]MDR7507419.1 agmatinase [Armatimonadota bacterium]